MQASTTRPWLRNSPLLDSLRSMPGYFFQPVRLLRAYDKSYLRLDLMAGLTVGVVALPQGIAFSILAGLPPEMGVYASIVASIVASLWGSSNQLSTGPTNSSSLLVFSILLPLAQPGSPSYIAAAGLLALMAGIFRVGMGLARLGVLVNFVSDSVVVGFTAGAGVLIIINQIRPILGLTFPSSPALVVTVGNLVIHSPETHLISLALGVGTIVTVLVLRRINRNLPAPLIAMGLAALVVAVFNLQEMGVAVLSELPRGFPPLADLPLLNLTMIGDLSAGALAVAVIGLVEAMAIARSISSQTGQRLDSNQEFVGQGLANIATGFFSGYPCSGSFNRSSLNYEAGARTPLAGVFAGLFVLVIVFVLAPVAVFVPVPTIAATLILSAYAMIDRQEMLRIWRGTKGDTLIMIVTFLGTLLLPLQFAVLTGVLMSLAYYIWRTSVPRVHAVVPDEHFKHFVRQAVPGGAPGRPICPQLGILEILGDLYFGAAPHVEEAILRNLRANPHQRYVLLRMMSVTQIDISGIHMLESVIRTYRDLGGDVFIVRVQQPVYDFMKTTGFVAYLEDSHFLDDDEAISHLFYRVLDPTICIYECEARVFKECQNLPKQSVPPDLLLHTMLPAKAIPTVPPQELWQRLRSPNPPRVYDVREPREFQRAHIPRAESLPLLQVLRDSLDLPQDRPIVLACRTGRRSLRAAAALQSRGYDDVSILAGGLVAWEAAGLLEAVALNLPDTPAASLQHKE